MTCGIKYLYIRGMDSPSCNLAILEIKTAGLGLAARTDAQAPPVRTNEAGTEALGSPEETGEEFLPRLVTRGESIDTPHPLNCGESYRFVIGTHGHARIELTPLPKDGVPSFAALTDWLNVTFPFEGTDSAIGEFLKQIDSHLGRKLGGMTDKNRGMHGY